MYEGIYFNICTEPKNIFVLSGFARRLFVHKYVAMVERSLFIANSTSSKFPTRKGGSHQHLSQSYNFSHKDVQTKGLHSKVKVYISILRTHVIKKDWAYA